MNAKDIVGLYCDDITFCWNACNMKSCPRNSCNVRDRTIPHSYMVEIPSDCPKKDDSFTKQQAIQEIKEYLEDADKAISEDEEYIRGWKSAMITALEIVNKIEGVIA